MNSEIRMSVSALTRHGEKKAVYVLFCDGAKSAEFAIPEGRLIHNDGFSEEELGQLRDYIKNEQDYLFRIAKEVNPIKGFMGSRQEKES